MTMLTRRYGAHPLHLIGLLASFALAGYAAFLLVQSQTIAVIVWFVGAAVGHDLVLLPLYAIADRTYAHRRPGRSEASGPSPWVNYIRVPAMLSGLLLLVFLPSIARLSDIYSATTDLSSSSYFVRWLGITGALFLLSGLLLALRLRRGTHAAPGPRPDDAPDLGDDRD